MFVSQQKVQESNGKKRRNETILNEDETTEDILENMSIKQ